MIFKAVPRFHIYEIYNMRYALITGVAGGMGFASAKKLIRAGFTVFGLDIKKPLETEGLVFIYVDLTDASSVKDAFDAVSGMTDGIDCIINMAGIYDLNSLVEMPDKDFERIFAVNLFSVFRVNKTFLPLLKKNGRIIITTSELAPLSPLPFTGIYGVTKTAAESYALSLRMELQLLGHEVIIIRPGAVDTGLLGVSTKRLDDFCSGTSLYGCNSVRFRNIVERVEARKIPPEKIAETALKAVCAGRPKIIYKINRNPLLLLMDRLPVRLQNYIIKLILS